MSVLCCTGLYSHHTKFGLPKLDETFPPGAVTFSDIDLNEDSVGGTITIEKAADETNLTHYAIHWGNQDPEPPTGETRSENATNPNALDPSPDGYGAGGDDCVAFNAPEFMVAKIPVDAFDETENITFELPIGTEIPLDNQGKPAATFVVHSLYSDGIPDFIGFSDFHNIRECLIRNSADIAGNCGELS
jgi:hypothetical protein